MLLERGLEAEVVATESGELALPWLCMEAKGVDVVDKEVVGTADVFGWTNEKIIH